MMRTPRLAVLLATLIIAVALPVHADMALNPDVRQDTIDSTICVPGYTAQVRPSTSYTNGVKLKLLREKGLDESQAGDYELDHIIPLAIGGHPRSLDNLMLQPWPEAKRKDRLEVKLQCLVCTGQVSLEEAQQAVYGNWEAAYHHYATIKCNRHKQDDE